MKFNPNNKIRLIDYPQYTYIVVSYFTHPINGEVLVIWDGKSSYEWGYEKEYELVPEVMPWKIGDIVKMTYSNDFPEEFWWMIKFNEEESANCIDFKGVYGLMNKYDFEKGNAVIVGHIS